VADPDRPLGGKVALVTGASRFGTDMSAPAFTEDNPRLRDRLLRDIPARRIGRPEEIGPLAVYLASAASDFMTGQTLFLDGGHSAA
jgi:gluconate 5-dehydrogenase